MIQRKDDTISDFIKAIQGKKLYCYGAGKLFGDFLFTYQAVDIFAVIDKYLCGKKQIKYGKEITIISLDEFVEQCDDNCVLLITCLNYQEVERELSQIRRFDSLPYYVYSILEEPVVSVCDRFDNEGIHIQIVEFRLHNYCAGNKAPDDVMNIAGNCGYHPLVIHRGNNEKHGLEQSNSEWERACGDIAENSTIIIQLPLCDTSNGIHKLLAEKRKKNIKVIGIIHDIDVFRGMECEYGFNQFELLTCLADVLVVHNLRMLNLLFQQGIDKDKMVNLEIFDYLVEKEQKTDLTEDGVIIAGNLLPQKAGYVSQLKEIKNVKFNLFGINYVEQKEANNVKYYGAFPPDKLIENLRGSYGLVWDGDSIETCSGSYGQYLKINNPHKLSLYLAAGIPVIIWDEAAEADFVLREGVGITVSSLLELSEKLSLINEEKYEKMKRNACRVGKQLRNGEYMKKAIRLAEQKLNTET